MKLINAAIWTAVALTIVGPVACTSSNLQAVYSADEAVLTALPVACAVADTIDASGATVTCAVLSAAGEILASVTKQLASPAVAAAVVQAHPATAPQTVALKAAAVMSLAKKP